MYDDPKPCDPSPCGVNAICKEKNGVGSCSCMKNFFGDPYINCKPQCIVNSDCEASHACINNNCVDICLGVCGINARYEVVELVITSFHEKN